jgi:hypothetical protein
VFQIVGLFSFSRYIISILCYICRHNMKQVHNKNYMSRKAKTTCNLKSSALSMNLFCQMCALNLILEKDANAITVCYYIYS